MSIEFEYDLLGRTSTLAVTEAVIAALHPG
jgi:hypothetical protein